MFTVYARISKSFVGMKLAQINPKILSFAKREQFRVKATRTRLEAASVDDPLKKYPPAF